MDTDIIMLAQEKVKDNPGKDWQLKIIEEAGEVIHAVAEKMEIDSQVKYFTKGEDFQCALEEMSDLLFNFICYFIANDIAPGILEALIIEKTKKRFPREYKRFMEKKHETN